jgi:hypothetical protein
MRTLAIFSAPGMASNRCGIALLNRNEETKLPCAGEEHGRGVLRTLQSPATCNGAVRG